MAIHGVSYNARACGLALSTDGTPPPLHEACTEDQPACNPDFAWASPSSTEATKGRLSPAMCPSTAPVELALTAAQFGLMKAEKPFEEVVSELKNATLAWVSNDR